MKLNKLFTILLLTTSSAFAVDVPDPIKTPGDALPYTKAQICAGVVRKAVTSTRRAT